MKKQTLLTAILMLLLTACAPIAMQDGNKMHHDGKMHGDDQMAMPSNIDLVGDAFYPEGVTTDGRSVFVASFISGEIQRVDLESGESTTLVEAGVDGVIAGWGLFYDEANDLVLSCGNTSGFGEPPTTPNVVRAVNPETGDITQSWALPDGAICNAVTVDNKGNIYLSNVGLAADIIRIDRATDTVSIWAADARWPNDSGFGLAGAIFDEQNSVYTHFGGGFFRIPINEDGSAGEAIQQRIVDVEGNETAIPGVDGLAWAGNNTMLSTNTDFQNGGSEVVRLIAIGSETLVVDSVFNDIHHAASIAIDGSTVYVTDAQFLNSLFQQAPPDLPFQVKAFALKYGSASAGLEADWQSVACEVRPSPNQDGGVDPSYLKREITIDHGQLFANFHYFGDPACTFPIFDVSFSGVAPVVGTMDDVAAGAVQVNLINGRAAITPFADFMVNTLNSAQVCGANTWESGVSQDILPVGCDVLGIAPNTLVIEYETLLAKDHHLYFGARPVDGTVLDTPETRPLTLQIALTQVKQ
ncbi:MAG: hypothetical protein AAF485_07610 [Chloroflexota bacterium]